MNEQLMESLRTVENEKKSLSPYERLNEHLSKELKEKFDGNRFHDVNCLVTFYNYIKSNNDYANYFNQYKGPFSDNLIKYYDEIALKDDFDKLVNSGYEFLDTFIDLSSDDLSQRLADIAKEKAKSDSNYLGLYNKISEITKKYNKNVNIDYSFITGSLINDSSDEKKVDIDSAISGMQDALDDINNVVPVEEPKLKDDIQDSFDSKVKESEEKINGLESNNDYDSVQTNIDEQASKALEKINKMVDDAKIDPNLGYEASSLDEDKNKDKAVEQKTNVDLGSFGRPSINSTDDYKNASADIQSKIEALNMEQRALEKANQERIDKMVNEKASELGVSKESLEKYMDKNNVSINEIDKIVVSPTMESQIAANEAVAQLPKTSFTRLVERLFSNLKLKNSDLEIEEKGNESVLNISLDTSKAQKISSMEKKIYDKLIRSSQRRKKVNKWIVDTKNNVKNAIKNVFSKLKETDTKNKERFSNKLHEVADKIYTPENKQTNNEYEVSVFDLLNKLNEKQIIGKEGSQVGEIENPDLEIEKSAKTM